MSLMDDLLSTVNEAAIAPVGQQPPTPEPAPAPDAVPELEPGWYSDEFKNYVSGSGK